MKLKPKDHVISDDAWKVNQITSDELFSLQFNFAAGYTFERAGSTEIDLMADRYEDGSPIPHGHAIIIPPRRTVILSGHLCPDIAIGRPIIHSTAEGGYSHSSRSIYWAIRSGKNKEIYRATQRLIDISYRRTLRHEHRWVVVDEDLILIEPFVTKREASLLLKKNGAVTKTRDRILVNDQGWLLLSRDQWELQLSKSA